MLDLSHALDHIFNSLAGGAPSGREEKANPGFRLGDPADPRIKSMILRQIKPHVDALPREERLAVKHCLEYLIDESREHPDKIVHSFNSDYFPGNLIPLRLPQNPEPFFTRLNYMLEMDRV